MCNVLLTCAGRRNYLIGFFREALAGRGLVLAADTAETAAALQEADLALQVPPVSHPDYFDRLLELCREHRVRLLLSLNDLELPLLARQRDRFLAVGTLPVVSSPAVIDLCFDKLATGRFLQQIGVCTPRTWTTLEAARTAIAGGELRFPLVIKPRWGTASIGIEYPESEQELELAWRLGHLRLRRTFLAEASAVDREHCLLIQERLSGIEHGLDVVNDLKGEYVATFARRKLSMRAGETDQAVTVSHPGLQALGERIGQSLGHIGNLDCDVFVDGDRLHVLELNPRFGGGYPFTHQAGVDLPAALVAWGNGLPTESTWLQMRHGIAAAKCDRLVPVHCVWSATGVKSRKADRSVAMGGNQAVATSG